MAIGNILFDLRAGVGKLDSDFAKASKKISGKLGSIESLFKKAGAAFGAYMGGRALVGLVNASVDAGAAVNDLVQRTGIAAEALQELRYAGDMAGVSVSDMDASLQRFNRRLGAAANGNEAMAKAFKSAGLAIRDSSGRVKSADTLFMELADQMAKLPSDAQRAAHGMNLFGDAGLRMGPVFKGGAAGLQEMRDQAAKFGAVMSADAVAASARFSDNLKHISMLSKGTRDAIVRGLLPAMEGLTAWFLDAGGGAQKFSTMTEWTGKALDVLADTIDNLAIYFQMLLAPIREALPTWDELRTSILSITGSADGASLSMKVLTGAFKYAQLAGTVIATIFTHLGKTIGAVGGAVVAVFSGDFGEAAQIAKDWSADYVADTDAMLGKVKGIWSKSVVDVQTEAAKLSPGLRAGLERVREASAGAGAAVRSGLAPALGLSAEAAAKAAKAAEALAAKLREAAFATRELVAQATGDKLGVLQVQYERETAALGRALEDKEILQADYDAQSKARETVHLQEVEALRRESERRSIDAQMETNAIRAGITESRFDDLKVAHDREMEMVRRLEEDKTLTLAEASQRRLALQAQYTHEATEAMKAEAEKSQQVGLGIADAIASGLRDGFTSDSFQDIFRSLLTMFSRIASLIPGGQMAGGVSGIFAGMFAEGGLIRGAGTGTSDSNLALVSDGEFVNTADTVRRFGSRFFDRLNEGVIDLSSLARYATGGIVGSPQPALAGAVVGGGHTTVNYNTVFDPRTMTEMMGATVEPAAYRRSFARADAKAVEMQRRRVRAPRAGRVV